ncbi:MAG: hypothetical protein K2M95_01200, partial [Clostridiales bacterium]|nr:hypothetical protein [Clostridiales bacterium]
MNLLAIKNLSSVVCYAVAAGLILILGLGFFVTLLRHKRTRKWYDVCMLILAFVVLFAGLVVGAFAVICKYKPLSLECARLDKKLLFLRKGKKLFSVPAIGYAVTLFEKLALAGLIVPFAVAFLALLTIIVVFAKTKKKKKVAKTAFKTAESAAPTDAYAKSAAQDAKTNDVTYAQRENVPHEERGKVEHEAREGVTHEQREGVEHETREQLTHTEEAYLASGEKPQLAASENAESAPQNEPIDEKEIMGEVFKLMDERDDTADLGDDLARAIEEGYAMMDDFAEEKISYELADDEEENAEYETEEASDEEETAESEESAETEETLYEEIEEAEDVLGVGEDEAAEAEAEDAYEEEPEDAYEDESPIEEEEQEFEEAVATEAAEDEAEETEDEEDAFDYAASAVAQ